MTRTGGRKKKGLKMKDSLKCRCEPTQLVLRYLDLQLHLTRGIFSMVLYSVAGFMRLP